MHENTRQEHITANTHIPARQHSRLLAAALSGNNLGQVAHTNVPLFTKQYNLVPCVHVNVPVGEYCSSGSAVIGSLRTAT